MNKVYGPWTTLASWSTVDSRRARAVHLVEAKRAGRYGVRDLAADAWGERGQRAELTSDGDERWGGEFGRVTKGNESCAAPVLHSEQRERKLGRGVSSVRHQRVSVPFIGWGDGRRAIHEGMVADSRGLLSWPQRRRGGGRRRF
jgi:hypothetical protein